MINSSQENTYQPREKRPYDPQNCEKNRDTCHNGQNWGTTSTFLTQLLNLGDLILPCWSYFLLVIGVCLWTPCSWPSGLCTSHAELNGYLHTRFFKGYIPRGAKIFSHTAASNKYQERCLQKLHTTQDDRQDNIKANNSKSLTLQKQNTLKDWDNMKTKSWDKPLTQRVRGKEPGKTTDDVQESRTWISKSGGRSRVLFTLNRLHSHLWNPPAKPWNHANLSQRD
jgi:hypothetical protein